MPPPPNGPTPGSAILDEEESDALNTFLNADDYGFNSDPFMNPQNSFFTNLEYQIQPPTVVGTFTSYGQQPGPSIGQLPDAYLPEMNRNMTSIQHPAYINPGELAAATLLHNLPNQRPHSMSNESPARIRGSQMLPVRSQPLQASNRHRPQPGEPYTNSEQLERYGDNHYVEMVFDGHQAPPRDRQVSQMHARRDLNWGSDVNFSTANGFVAPAPHRREMEAMESGQANIVRGIFNEVPSSADNTRPSSPVMHRPIIGHRNTVINRLQDENGEGLDARKRSHNKLLEDEDEQDDEEEVVQQVKRRKPVKKNESPVPPEAKGRNRRKSSAAATAKAARENLSDAQKRQNHIQSEQKRRKLIKDGFEALDTLVPGLKGGGFSKSVALNMSADWLESMVQKNDRLRARLLELQGRR